MTRVFPSRVVVRARAFLSLGWAIGTASCSSRTDAGPTPETLDAGPIVESIVPDASCHVVLDDPPLLPALHVLVGTSIEWDSNPPSSGSHFPIWAAYAEYSSPVPRGYYVHNLEHGAIVFLYKCAGNSCPDVVAALETASNAIPDDPLCASQGEGVRVRTVITPDPDLDVPVAAAAWGYTYKADCVDLPSLTSFALAHYAKGPEVLCANGTTDF